MSLFAHEYAEIPTAIARNPEIATRMLSLIDEEGMVGKATEGPGRLDAFRAILRGLTHGSITVERAIRRVHDELPRAASPHRHDNNVFGSRWDERLVRTQFSRFYCEAVLQILLGRSEDRCFVPHSTAEGSSSSCTRMLAGRVHDARALLQAIVESYANGDWSNREKIPYHPNCTHVVAPLEDMSEGRQRHG